MAYIGRQPTVGNFRVCDAISVVDGQAAYTMQVGSVNVVPESANNMIVSLNGVIQKPGSSFTVSSSTITFSSNLSTGDVIDFIQILGGVANIGTPSDGTVTSAKITYPLTTFSSTGIDDNATSTAITIDSSENVGIGITNPTYPLQVYKATSGDIVRLGSVRTLDISNSDNGVYVGAIWDRDINSAGGIHTYSIEGNEKMRILPTGGITFNGDTAEANALDDYEEGSWTPGYEGTTGSAGSLAYTTQTGRYTKIGNTVFATGEIKLSNKGSFGGAIRISGLPFAPLAGLAINLGSIVLGNVDFATGVVGFNGVLASGSNFYIWKTTDNAVEAVMLTSDATNTSNFYFNFTYTTTS